MVFVKTSTFFSYVFFFSKKSLKETFFDILDRRECFLDHKRKLLKNSKKIDILQRGQFMVFVKKSTFSLSVLSSKESQKETFFDILDRKQSFWTSKVKFSQTRKKSTFFKGFSPWFFSKNRPFSYMFFLTKKNQKERFFDILDRKECLLDLKSEILKRSKKSTFCKRVSP